MQVVAKAYSKGKPNGMEKFLPLLFSEELNNNDQPVANIANAHGCLNTNTSHSQPDQPPANRVYLKHERADEYLEMTLALQSPKEVKLKPSQDYLYALPETAVVPYQDHIAEVFMRSAALNFITQLHILVWACCNLFSKLAEYHKPIESEVQEFISKQAFFTSHITRKSTDDWGCFSQPRSKACDSEGTVAVQYLAVFQACVFIHVASEVTFSSAVMNDRNDIEAMKQQHTTPDETHQPSESVDECQRKKAFFASPQIDHYPSEHAFFSGSGVSSSSKPTSLLPYDPAPTKSLLPFSGSTSLPPHTAITSLPPQRACTNPVSNITLVSQGLYTVLCILMMGLLAYTIDISVYTRGPKHHKNLKRRRRRHKQGTSAANTPPRQSPSLAPSASGTTSTGSRKISTSSCGGDGGDEEDTPRKLRKEPKSALPFMLTGKKVSKFRKQFHTYRPCKRLFSTKRKLAKNKSQKPQRKLTRCLFNKVVKLYPKPARKICSRVEKRKETSNVQSPAMKKEHDFLVKRKWTSLSLATTNKSSGDSMVPNSATPPVSSLQSRQPNEVDRRNPRNERRDSTAVNLTPHPLLPATKEPRTKLVRVVPPQSDKPHQTAPEVVPPHTHFLFTPLSRLVPGMSYADVVKKSDTSTTLESRISSSLCTPSDHLSIPPVLDVVYSKPTSELENGTSSPQDSTSKPTTTGGSVDALLNTEAQPDFPLELQAVPRGSDISAEEPSETQQAELVTSTEHGTSSLSSQSEHSSRPLSPAAMVLQPVVHVQPNDDGGPQAQVATPLERPVCETVYNNTTKLLLRQRSFTGEHTGEQNENFPMHDGGIRPAVRNQPQGDGDLQQHEWEEPQHVSDRYPVDRFCLALKRYDRHFNPPHAQAQDDLFDFQEDEETTAPQIALPLSTHISFRFGDSDYGSFNALIEAPPCEQIQPPVVSNTPDPTGFLEYRQRSAFTYLTARRYPQAYIDNTAIRAQQN